jgi:hypothetical protein
VKIQFHPEAYKEMLASARFYEKRAEGLGKDFLAAVEGATQLDFDLCDQRSAGLPAPSYRQSVRNGLR